ncbi:alanine--glyoxylate aminotransferase 2-like [Harmonia axyridis]|uniref:alanine--glyoxylate aminotransferase 2-like n=1 Tax=Harmonia axyridis TaxID=115357 RepID=UPI001E2776A3|nr:alanine--glyoxylate aminotransferase 2-like [Harmonia axyridis]
MEKMSKGDTLAMRNKYIGKSCQLFFRQDPLKVVRALGQYMYDEKDEAYLDCVNNVAHVGHCHPKVVEAGCRQMKLLYTNNRYLHDNIVICAKRLVETMPKGLNTCFFVNSGSEANDLAIRLAQIYTKNKDIIALEGAYHGHLTSLIDISHYKFSLPGGTGQKDHVHLASLPDIYRGKFNTTEHKEEEISHLYAEEVREICHNVRNEKDAGICAFIHESLVSCGGQIMLPRNYLSEIYEHVRNNGGVCIADEVQVGFGRTGKHWWAFELQNVVPDIVTLGKPMGNGHPVAAVITTKAIAECFENTGVEYFNTYGGNPVSCAIANAVMDVIEDEKLMENACVVGDYLKKRCMMLKSKYSIIGDVRGVGLFIGIEIVEDKESRKPNPEAATIIHRWMKEHHILLSVDGLDKNVIKIKPPMIFTEENADEVVSTLDKVLAGLEGSNDLTKDNRYYQSGYCKMNK